jgi:hypothetical protein
MVEKLTPDRAGMRQTVALFTTMRAPVPESVRPGCRPATRPDVATPRASGPQPAAAFQLAKMRLTTFLRKQRDFGGRFQLGPQLTAI